MKQIRFRDFLPRRMKETRWATIFDKFEETISDIKDAFIYKLRDKYRFNRMDIAELQDWMFRVGYNLPFFNGYTRTLSFFKKQAQVVVKQIRNKTTEKGYQYAYYVYNMLGNVYVQRLQSGIYVPQYSPLANIDVAKSIIKFDQHLPEIDFINNGVFYPNNPPIPTNLPEATYDSADEPSPDAQFLFFDGNAELDYTNHFTLTYSWRFIESATPPVYMSTETARSFYESTQQLKRRIEVIHYQPRLEFDVSTLGNTYKIPCTTEDFEGEAVFCARYFEPHIPLEDIVKVRFGLRGFNDLTDDVIDVDVFASENFIANDFYIRDISANKLIMELRMGEYTIYTFGDNFAFSEVCFMDVSDAPVIYAKFPRISFDPRMLNSVWFDITVV